MFRSSVRSEVRSYTDEDIGARDRGFLDGLSYVSLIAICLSCVYQAAEIYYERDMHEILRYVVTDSQRSMLPQRMVW